MAKPTQSIFPVENGKLVTNLDCNNLQLVNLDESNLSGGGGGGSGNDTGTTVAILKGDGNHGFADAVADVDYASAGSVAGLETSAAHDADMTTLTGLISINTNDITNLTIEVNNKADASDTTAALALKADDADLTAYIASNDADVALKAYTSDVNSALGFKADTSLVTTGLANKEPLLPASPADGYILSRDLDQTWHFVDPISLGGGGGGGGGTGTVTSVGVNNTLTDVFTTSVTNATSSAVINIAGTTTVGANRFYGNFTAFTGAAGFGTAAVARASLGGTTVGQAIFQLANPSQVGFIRTNVDNSVTALTSAATLSAIGGESALTFSAPLTRTLNAIAIPVVSGSNPVRDGYITGVDFATLQAKVGPNRTITTTAPLTIDGLASADLSVNRTLAMPAAASSPLQVSGYLTGADHATFTAKPPNTRSLAVIAPLTMSPGTVSGTPPNTTTTGDLSANRTIAIPKATSSIDGYLAAADFATLIGGSVGAVQINNLGGAITISSVASPRITKVFIVGAAFTSRQDITLPAAGSYGSSLNFPSIEIIDLTSGIYSSGGFGIRIIRQSTDTIDGTTQVDLPLGAGYTRVNSDGANRWTRTKYFVDTFKDALNPLKSATVDVSGLTASASRTFKVADATTSVSVVPFDPIGPTIALPNTPQQFLTCLGGTATVGNTTAGLFQSATVKATDIITLEATVDGTIDAALTPSDGTLGSVRLKTANVKLTATRTYTFPNVDLYSAGETVRFYDASGCVDTTNFVRVISGSGNNFNGATAIDIVEPFFNRVFVADPVGHNWTVSTFGGGTGSGLTLDTWHSVVPSGGVATVTCTQNVVENLHIVTMVGPITLLMTGFINNGTTGRIRFNDQNGGNHVVTVPNNIARTPTAEGTGVFTVSTGANITDEWGWDYDGNKYHFFPLGKNMVAASAPTFSTPTDDTDTSPSTSGTDPQGSIIGAKYGIATKLVASMAYTLGSLKLRLNKIGSPTYNIYARILADNGTGNAPSTTQVGNASNLVLASSLGTDTLITFNPLATLTSGGIYWIVLYGDQIGRVVSDLTVTSGSNILTSAGAANFGNADVGSLVQGSRFATPAPTIISVTDSTHATLSSNALSTGGTGATTIGAVNTVNNVTWAYHSPSSGNATFHSSDGTAWISASSSRMHKYITYR